MTTRSANLYHWQGPINGGPYFLIGAGLLIAKYFLDWLIAAIVFDRSWTVINYLVLPGKAVRLLELPEPDRVFYGTLLLLALPFIWVGTVLTLRRLRTVGLPTALVVFFFVPVVNLFFFLSLSVLRSREERDAPAALAVGPPSAQADVHVRPAGEPIVEIHPADPDERVAERLRLIEAIHRKVVPDRAGADGTFALAISVPLAMLYTILGVKGLHSYGWGLFVGMPFSLGMGSALLYGLRRPKTVGQCIGLACLSIVFLGIGLIAIAFEGVICLIMASPLAFVLAIMGSLIGYTIQARPWGRDDLSPVWLALVVTLPALMAAERAGHPEPELVEVISFIDIDASPERVWESVIAFPELTEPDEWLFRAGVAYPTRAEIQGSGVGAVRRCVFSTGAFVEPITTWDPPRKLAFDVADQPAPMVELSPYEIHPPHLDHFLESRRGEFLLIRLPDGRTRLQGTTWYTNKMWPEAYWRLWSDHIIHQIHLRVLRHIRETAEQPGTHTQSRFSFSIRHHVG